MFNLSHNLLENYKHNGKYLKAKWNNNEKNHSFITLSRLRIDIELNEKDKISKFSLT